MAVRRLLGLVLLAACGSDPSTSADVVANDTAEPATPDTPAADALADADDLAASDDTETSGETRADTAEDVAADTRDAGRETEVAPAIATLADHRDRLLDSLAAVRGAADRCALWDGMDGIERGVFLTHTDMLGNRTCTRDGCASMATMAIAHVANLWTINGSDPACSCSAEEDGYHCCNGGGEWHRTFFTADDVLIAALRAGEVPGWRPSLDVAGPHHPFTRSLETVVGSPRGQIHCFARDEDAVPLEREGVEGVFEPHIVELDNDYNILHDSNPEGCYGFAGLLCTYGRVLYRSSWHGYGNAAPTTFRDNGEPSPQTALAADEVYRPCDR